ncbi:MAG: hypothetical protein LBD16_08495 [Oscillospiraceae bacterium]|jgi:CBS domain-containing protein|nr:hypothetical protein [Oscillospiraceae bacterium]
MTELSARFVELYRCVETELEQRLSGRPRRHTSAVMEYLASPESRPVRADLDVAREIRNIIMHNADDNGEPVVEPSRGITDALSRVLDYINSPPLALTFATTASEILYARINDQALPLMRAMRKRGFSHVPIMDGERVNGVFSSQSLMSFISDNPSVVIDANTRLLTFEQYLPIDSHLPEQYRFMAEGATLADVKQAFEDKRERNSRLAAMFITRTGGASEPLLGMITPWDVLGGRGVELSQ